MDDEGAPRSAPPPPGPPREDSGAGAERSQRGLHWLAVPLLCVVLAAVVAIDVDGGLWAAPGSAQSVVAASCNGSSPPEVARLGGRELAQLRSAAVAPMRGRVARLYEQGTVGSSNLLTDDVPAPAAAAGSAPGGYEARWWALDREGREDDVVVDALHYRDAADARRMLALASNPSCHRQGSAGTALFPAGARTLGWLNPDHAYQRDTLFAVGPYLYETSDVPPGTGEGSAGFAQAASERGRAAITTEVLACALPQARCPRTLARAAEHAGMPALARPPAPAPWPTSRSDASRFLQTVSLHAYDVPYLSATTAGTGQVADAMQLLAQCLRPPPGELQASASSPLYSARGAERRRATRSFAWLLADESDAAHAEASFARALGNGCVQRGYGRSFRRLREIHPDTLFGRPRLTALATARPATYPAHEPYRATAERVAVEVLVRTRNSGPGVLRLYAQAFVFAYKRAVVELATSTAFAPLPETDRRYLESALVGRAVANWGVSR